MKKIFYSSIFVILNVAFLNVEGMQPRSSDIPNGPREVLLRQVTSTQRKIQHIYADNCTRSDQMVIPAKAQGGYDPKAQNTVIHLGDINLTTYLEMLRDLGQKYTVVAKKIYHDYNKSSIHLGGVDLATFLYALRSLEKKYIIMVDKIFADCSGTAKDIFDEIFGPGMYETNYVRDPERFLDCILSGNKLELSAQEDLRQELIERGWSDDSAKNCKVVLSWPDDLQYEYKSNNPRLEKVIQYGL